MRAGPSILVAAPLAAAMTSTGYQGYGLIGYGISMYYPTCAHACQDVLSSYQLNCSVVVDEDGMAVGDMPMPVPMIMTSPDCYATDDNFLRSMAYCISTHCLSVPVSDIEHYWETFLVGQSYGQPSPKEPYTIALLHADPPPTEIVSARKLLNATTLVNEQAYLADCNGNSSFERMETRQSGFGLTLLIAGAVIPIACSLLRSVPFPKVLMSRFNGYFIDSPLFGHRHREPFRNLALVPTRGQAVLIGYFIVVNIILSCVDYSVVSPNSWYATESGQLLVYITNRQGVLSFANLPLLVLYSSRNNLLLWITNWSHLTFLLLHRWVAIICVIQACLHSAIYLQIYVFLGMHTTESKLTYWIWGIVATLAMFIMLPASIIPLRKKLYNVFLASHFVLAFIALIGCFFHIYYRYANQWGYEMWLYIAFALWGFDRLARFARLARNGIRVAEITRIDEDYISVHVPSVAAQGHAYLYFPTISWRVWENHPFSVMGTLIPQELRKTFDGGRSGFHAKDPEKASPHASTSASFDSDASTSPPSFKSGLIFFIRTTEKGFTASLRRKTKLPVLVESSYTASALDELRTIPNCVVFAGGVGISAVTPLLRTRGAGSTRLFWGLRSEPLADAVKSVLGSDVMASCVVGEVAVGRRLDVRAILEREIIDDGETETAVVVCGPGTMADEVRAVVCELAQKGRVVRLIDEAFSW